MDRVDNRLEHRKTLRRQADTSADYNTVIACRSQVTLHRPPSGFYLPGDMLGVEGSWTRHLGVTQQELARAIERVGNSAATVRKQLGTSKVASQSK